MKQKILALLGGLCAGVLGSAIIVGISSLLFPLAAEIELQGKEAFKKYVDGLPVAAFLLVWIGHALAAFLAGWISSLLVGKRWLPGAIGLGGFFLVAGITNLFSIPHPIWFAILDVTTYIPAALVGAMLVPKASSQESPPEIEIAD